jgi:Protein of unknown function (DUF1376)
MLNPLTPPDCDLRDFAYMPIEIKRLLTSETWMLGSGDERAASMCLWLESWHQVPAGSLPSNDRILEHLAQSKAWKRIRVHVMAGWVLCADGRMYHPVVAEKALEAWLEKLAHRLSSGAGNAKRWSIEFDPTPIYEKIELAKYLLTELNPSNKAINRSARKTVGPKQTSSAGPDGTVKPPDGTPKTVLSGSQEKEKEKGTEKGTGITKDKEASPVAGAPLSAKPTKPIALPVEVPDWVPIEAWEGFLAMRQAMGKSIPFTKAAAEGILKKLGKLRDAGQDPCEVLEQSTRSSWRDVFAVKVDAVNRLIPPVSSFRQSTSDRRAEFAAGMSGQSNHQGQKNDFIDVSSHVVG